ncbi:hypothetical protein ACOSP7_021040 [Xanthoceras sorbifolium]
MNTSMDRPSLAFEDVPVPSSENVSAPNFKNVSAPTLELSPKRKGWSVVLIPLGQLRGSNVTSVKVRCCGERHRCFETAVVGFEAERASLEVDREAAKERDALKGRVEALEADKVVLTTEKDEATASVNSVIDAAVSARVEA